MNFVQPIAIYINFICHIVTFCGGFYIAMYSRTLPRWLVTSLWYIGLSAFLTAITIASQWMFGEDFPMAYIKMNFFTEVILNINLAITVILLLYNTFLHGPEKK